MEIPKIKVTNPNNLFAAGIKACVALAIAYLSPLSIITAFTQGVDGFIKFTDAFGKKRKDVGAQAYLIITQSYFISLGVALRKYVEGDPTLQAAIEKHVATDTESIKEYDFSTLALQPLISNPLVSDLRGLTSKFLLENKIPHATVTSILEEVESALQLQFGHYLWLRREKNQEFHDWYYELVPPENRDIKRGEAIKEYKEQLRGNFKRPLEIARETPFATNFTLENVYIESMARFGSSTEAKQEPVLALAMQMIDKSRSVIVHGQPGHGKTSFARMLCRKILEERLDIFPIFLEFNAIPVNTPFLDHLKLMVGDWIDIDFLKSHRTLFIIDGLDEVQSIEGKSSFQPILQGINIVIDLANERAGHIVSTKLFTGRTNFIDSYRNYFMDSPFYVEICDFSGGQQLEWMERLRKVTLQKETANKTLKQLKDFGYEEFLSQPVLLTMISFMVLENRTAAAIPHEKLDMSRAEVYDEIIRWTYHRKWGSAKANSLAFYISEFETYKSILQIIAHSIFASGHRSLSLDEVLKILAKDTGLSRQLKGVDLDLILDKTRISFYFKSVTGRKAVEFSHKSIEDFLVATSIESALIRLSLIRKAELRYWDSKKTAAPLLFGLFCNRSLDYAHADFIELLIMKWNKKQRLEVFEILEEIWKLLLFDPGISYEGLLPSVSHHVGSVNYAVSILHLLSRLNIVIHVVDKETALWKITEDNHAMGKIIDFIDSVEHGRFASSGIRLSYVDLSHAVLTRKYLRKMDFQYSILKRSNISNCVLLEANFFNADLENANLLRSLIDSDLFRDAGNTKGIMIGETLIERRGHADINDFKYTNWINYFKLEPLRHKTFEDQRYFDTFTYTEDKPKSFRVLIYEPENELRNLLKTKIEKQGIIADASGEKETILQLINHKDYTLVVTAVDVATDRLSFVKEIQARRDGMAIIVLPNIADINFLIETIQLGVRDCIMKPLEIPKLILSINRLRAVRDS